ncbi:excinuclease ABC subunit UvrA [Schlesneria paludicola]|uniref:ATP-binding cassette domain-containing protein n=1 Tax=Schlesneria paludicola TaxID=360056 RepID=UPI00029A6328|nr:ATP-binding cassette domain-containing protein [Schlesneria paludicola]
MAPPLASRAVAVRQIELRGVRVHNLKSLDLDIPLNQFVVVTGVSGSGKTSLAFDTVLAEGQRRYIESFSVSARRHLERIERPDADRIAHVPVAIPVRGDRRRGGRTDPRTSLAMLADVLDGLSLLYTRKGQIICPGCGREIRAKAPADLVAAVETLGEGTRCQLGFVPPDVVPPETAAGWLARGFSRAIWEGVTHDLSVSTAWPESAEKRLIVDRFIAGKSSAARIVESAETAFREGEGRCWLFVEARESPSGESQIIDGRHWEMLVFSRRLECDACQRTFLPLEPRLFNPLSTGACLNCRGTGQLVGEDGSESVTCSACSGSRLRDEARAVRVGDHFLPDLLCMTADQILSFLIRLNDADPQGHHQSAERIRGDLMQRLTVIASLGLNYLTLGRAADSLSCGEVCRATLAAVLGARVTGALVVIDEPSAGLTPEEIPCVVQALRQLQSLRNSVLVVDHAIALVEASDHVIELGPGAGPTGGSIVYQGPPLPLATSAATGSRETRPPKQAATELQIAASGRERQKSRKAKSNALCLRNIEHHTLRQIDIEFPLGQLCVVTGRSGCGKTSLVVQVLYPAICRRLGQSCDVFPQGTCDLTGGDNLIDVALVDQSPLTKSSRSNPASWLNVFDEIRQTFASTKDAKQRGFTGQQFSFNSAQGGRCRSCLGTGLLKLDMQFLPDVTMNCPECGGTRYRPEILEVQYRGRSIADVLAMSVAEAAVFFRSQPRIQSRIQFLQQIGLDYLVLGQPSDSLSGGEAQRLKLASRLLVPHRGASLILCDEPTLGLHARDVERLLVCFRELLASGHSVIVADTSPELIASADAVLDLGRFGSKG